MDRLVSHLRNKLVAGALAAAPLVVIVWGAMWLEEHTAPLTRPLGVHFPGLGILLALVGIYLLGLIVTSLLGRYAMGWGDRLLRRIPGLSQLYRTCKDVFGTPEGTTGIFQKVVLVPGPDGRGVQLAFAAESTGATPGRFCVFVPNAPNPISGRLVLMDRSDCQATGISLEDAFKFLLSTGNYVPTELAGPSKAQEAGNYMLFKLARFMQLAGLIIVPIAVAGNLVDVADAEKSIDLKTSLVIAGVGVAIFYLGWWLQQRVKPS